MSDTNISDEPSALTVTGLRKTFPVPRSAGGGAVHAVAGVDLMIGRGEIVGLVGESGSGKTTVAHCVARLLNRTPARSPSMGPTSRTCPGASSRRLRPKMHMVFQDPYSSLNPRMKVADIVAAPLRAQRHVRPVSRRKLNAEVDEMLAQVGLSPQLRGRYPHELSGGQRQRVGLARSLIARPLLLVADEPTRRSTSRSRPPSSTSSPTCSATSASPACSSRTTSRSCITSATGLRSCSEVRSSRPAPASRSSGRRVTPTPGSCSPRRRSVPDHHLVRQRPDRLDRHRHLVAVGQRADASGVPVSSTSPGSRVITDDTYSTSDGTSYSSSDVRECCLTDPHAITVITSGIPRLSGGGRDCAAPGEPCARRSSRAARRPGWRGAPLARPPRSRRRSRTARCRHPPLRRGR